MKPIFILLTFILSISMITSSYGIDIDTSSEFLYPGYSKKISMDFQDASLVDVLKIFSQQTNLNLITAESVASKRVTIYLDNVPVEEALEQILRANSLTYEIKPGSDIYTIKPIQRPNSELATRVYPLKHASVDSSKIKTLISVKAEGGGGGSSGGGIIQVIESVLTSNGKIKEDMRTNSLIITDIVTNFPNIDQAIARLDISVPQVLIEVEMLEVEKSISDKIGIKWGGPFLQFSGGEKLGAFPFDGSVPFFSKPGGIDYDDGRISVSTMSAKSLTLTLEFLKSQTDTKNLARPRILTLNNQAAEIKITTDEAIAVTETTSTESTQYRTYDVERAETGVSLIVTPQANIESGVITMAVQPKVILSKTAGSFGSIEGIKDTEERSAKSILKVQTGDTIVIGGLVKEETTNVYTKVPILGDIPIIGRIFRHQSLSTKERELLVFITPHIIYDQDDSKSGAVPTKQLLREQYAPKVTLNP